MLKAFIRLGLISAGSLILILFTVVFIRAMGLQQVFASPPHPWFDQAYWSVYEPRDICSKKGQFAPDTIVLITVSFRDEDWWVNCKQDLTLDQMLKSSSHLNWILRVKANDSSNLDKLVDIVSPYDANKKFAFITDSQRAARFLRKKGPQWLFAADPSSLVRMQLFTSLWIETAMDFWPDFVIASGAASQPAHLNERLARELNRRQKRIIWDGDQNPLIPVQGRVTDNP